MKFGQLIKYNMRNIFLENYYTKCGREAIPLHFSKKSKLSISRDQSLKFHAVYFYCMPDTKFQTTGFNLI